MPQTVTRPATRARRVRRRGFLAFILATFFGATLLTLGAGAGAMAESCPAGSTLVSAGVCEVVFTSTPNSNWTPPAGITRLQALVVGGGGAGGYTNPNQVGLGGGGGDVKIVDLAATGDVTVVVGVGRQAVVQQAVGYVYDSSVAQGGTTTTAVAGTSGTGGKGGSSFTYSSTGDGGAGSGGASASGAGGAGLVVGDLPGAPGSLFAGDPLCFGGGGASQGSTSGCGGGNVQPITTGAPIIQDLPRANSGGGGGGTYDADFGGIFLVLQNGADGIVVLRFSGATLPDTGVADLSDMAWTAVGVLALGAGAVAFAARPSLRRRGCHL